MLERLLPPALGQRRVDADGDRRSSGPSRGGHLSHSRQLDGHQPDGRAAIRRGLVHRHDLGGFGLYVLYAQERLNVGDLGFGVRAGLILETLSHAALALTHSPIVAGLIMFLFGVHAAVWGTTSTAVRQLAVPDSMLGRVNSVYLPGSLGGIAIGTLIGGALAAQFGLLSAFWFAFSGSLLALAFLWKPMAYVAHAAQVVDSSPAAG